jgi:HlyD family secretion protein
VDVGQTVAASMQAPTLFVIAADLTKMRVNTNVDEADVGRIRPDQLARFRVDAFPTEEFIGKVSQIRLQPVIQQNVVTYSTVVEVSNPQYKLKPGMTATISIEIARREHVLRVPNAALRFRPTEEMFLALNQQVPPELTRGVGGLSGGGRAGGGGGVAGGGVTGETVMAQRRGGSGRGQDRAGTDGAATIDTAVKSGSKTEPAAPGPDRLKKAQTIDALFGALPPVESSGRVWLFDGDQMKAARLRLGISDGNVTEIRSGTIAANAEVVTGIVLPASQTRGIGGATGNPLLGNQRPGQPGNRPPAGGRPGGR